MRIGKSWNSLFGKMNSIRAYGFSKLIYHATFHNYTKEDLKIISNQVNKSLWPKRVYKKE